MKKILIIGFAFLSILSACTDLSTTIYDRVPDENFPENETQSALMMIPIYKPMQSFLDGGGWWFAQEVTSDEMVAPTRNTDWDDGGKWRVLHTHTWTNDQEAINSMWYQFYKGIFEANKIIEYLQPAIDEGNEQAQIAVSKAKVMRCFYYWLAIDNYGDVPYVISYANAPALPTKELRETIWQNIVTELEENLQYLPATGSKYSVTKGMAFTLLAKLYLNAEVYTGTPYWKKAEDYCDSVIALNAFSLEANPLAPFVTENENSVENIFTIGYDKSASTGFNLHMRTLHYASGKTFNMSAQPWNGFCASESSFDLFEADDKRIEMFLIGQQYSVAGEELTDDGAGGANLVFTKEVPALKMTAPTYTLIEIRMSGARVVKFEVENGATDNLSNDFPIFRYADVLLMKAEAMVRQGGNGDDFINQVRTRAGLGNTSGATLDFILDERGREMAWEGHRRQDLIRFSKFTQEWWEKPNDNSQERTIFPIPKWAIEANSNLATNL